MTRKKSPLTVIERISPNQTKPRISSIRGSTPHHVAGNLTIESLLGMAKIITYNPTKGMSMNYAIGSDGRMGLVVEEFNRPWTSSSSTNDHRCITFEIANNGGAPDWRMTDEAINKFLDATVEACLFYNFKKVNYQVKPSNITPNKVEAWIKTWAKDDEWIITLHNWFAPTSCPGPYFTRQIPWLVGEMNKRLADANYKSEAFIGEGMMSDIVVPSKKTIVEIAKEVISGEWGNGQDRINRLTAAGYDSKEVQTEVTKLMTPTPKVNPIPVFTEYAVTIIASAVNVRTEPNINSSKVRTLINDKNTYTIVEEKTGPSGPNSTGKWGKLKSGIGWILLEFTKRK